LSTDQVLKSLAAITLCGILVRLVIRGKWVAWAHPVCSRCHFNLQGLPESSTRCPECGEELWKVRRNAIWKRRWISLGISALLILLTLWVVQRDMSIRTINEYAPTFALFQEARSRNLHWEGLYELHSRMNWGRLSESQKSELLEIALAEAKTSGGDWLIRDFRRSGQLPPSRLTPIVLKYLNPRFDMRPILGRDELLIIRATGVNPPLCRVRYTVTIAIDGADLSFATDSTPQWPASRPLSIDFNFPQAAPLLARLSDGEHHLTITASVDAIALDDNSLIASRKFVNGLPFTLLPPGQSSVKLIRPADTSAQRNFLELQEVYFDGIAPNFRRFGISPHALMNSTSPPGDIPMSYRVYIRDGKREQLLGSLLLFGYERFWLPPKTLPSSPGPNADVIFRPDPQLAATKFEITQILGAEFTQKNVPLQSTSPDRE
jgi:hypothetical protein